eukprot:gene2493-2870_t
MHRRKNEKHGELFGKVSVGRNDGLKALESSNAGRKSNENVEKGFFSQRNNADDNGGIMEEMPSGSAASSSGSRTDPLYEDWSESESEFSPESEPGYEAESKSESHEKFDYLSNENRLNENNEEKRMNEKSSVCGNEASQSVGLEVKAQNQPTQVEDKLEDYSSDDDDDDNCSDVDDSESDDIDVPETIAPLGIQIRTQITLFVIIRDIRMRTSSNVAPNINVIREIEESQIRHNATFEQVDNEMPVITSQIMDCEDETNMSTISKEKMGHGSVAAASWMHVENNTQGCHHLKFNPIEIEMKSERIDEEEPMDIDVDEEMITAFDRQMQIGNWLHAVHSRLPTPEPMDVDEAIEPSSNVFQMDSNLKQLGAAVESKLLTSASLPQQCKMKSVQEGHPGQWFFKAGNTSQDATTSGTSSNLAQLNKGGHSLSLKKNTLKRKHDEEDDGTSQGAQQRRPGKVLKARRSQESITTPAVVAELEDGENSSCLKRSMNKRRGNKKNNKTNISEPEEESPAKLAENAEMKQQVAVDGESANEKIKGRPWKLKRNAYKKNHVEQNNNNTCQQESGKMRKWM